MNNKDENFPRFQKSIENLIEDEEGNIPGKKLLVLGTLMVVLSSLMSIDAFADHRSHSSHSSHGSHSSHSSGSHGNSHSNHGSHESHQSHVSSTDSHSNHSNHASHSSHTSHSNTSAHSNSSYSAEGDVSYSAPAAIKVPTVSVQPVKITDDTFNLPDVNENVEIPNGTPGSQNMVSLAVPATSVGTKIDAGDIHSPSITDTIE